MMEDRRPVGQRRGGRGPRKTWGSEGLFMRIVQPPRITSGTVRGNVTVTRCQDCQGARLHEMRGLERDESIQYVESQL